MKALKYLPAIIIVILIAILAFDSISSKKTTQTVSKVDKEVIKRQVVDSVNKANRAVLKAKIDSMNEASNKRVKSLKTTISSLEKKLERQEDVYHSDTTLQSPETDSLISTAHQVIYSLKEENNVLSEVNTRLQEKIMIQDQEFSDAELSRDAAYENVNELIIQLNKKNNWWHRNEKWIFLGIGIVGMKMLIK